MNEYTYKGEKFRLEISSGSAEDRTIRVSSSSLGGYPRQVFVMSKGSLPWYDIDEEVGFGFRRDNGFDGSVFPTIEEAIDAACEEVIASRILVKAQREREEEQQRRRDRQQPL